MFSINFRFQNWLIYGLLTCAALSPPKEPVPKEYEGKEYYICQESLDKNKLKKLRLFALDTRDITASDGVLNELVSDIRNNIEARNTNLTAFNETEFKEFYKRLAAGEWEKTDPNYFPTISKQAIEFSKSETIPKIIWVSSTQDKNKFMKGIHGLVSIKSYDEAYKEVLLVVDIKSGNMLLNPIFLIRRFSFEESKDFLEFILAEIRKYLPTEGEKKKGLAGQLLDKILKYSNA